MAILQVLDDISKALSSLKTKKMNKLILNGLLIALISFTMLSCKKDKLEIIESDIEVAEKSIGTINPSNSFNDLDYYGKIHNQSLISVYSDGLNQNNSAEDYYNYFSIPNEQITFIEQTQPEFQKDPSNYNAYFTNLLNSNLVVSDYLKKIRLIIINPNSNLEKKIDLIKIFEKNFDYSSTDSKSSDILKIASSIARHSLYFWAPNSEGGLGYIDVLDPLDINSINWYEVGVEDFMSACVGAFFTANPRAALAGGVIGSAVSIIY